jgi:hypothetical protein
MTQHFISKTYISELTVVGKICLATVLVALPTHFSCSSSSQSQAHLVKVAEDRYGGEVEYSPNESQSFLLCVNKPKVQPGDPQQPVRFVLFDVARNEVVFEDSLENADVRWLSNDRIEVRAIPEIVSDDGDTASGYIFDTHTRTRTPIPVQRKERQ